MTLYSQVPKGLKENLEYRRDLLRWADTIERQRVLFTACKEDVLFFINAFCWLYEPRSSRLRGTTSNVIPFLTYEYQDRDFVHMNEVLGNRDIGIEKSRDLGATWMFLTLLFYQWMFHDFSSFGIMSRTADLVDKPGKKDTLMWKLDFLLTGDGGKGGLPPWMRPDVYRTAMLMENRSNGSTFEGASTTEDAFRGGRKKCIAIDEYAAFPNGDDYKALAATQHATDCRMFVSTPKGASGAYYDVMHQESNMLKVIMDWTEHPVRKRGLYTSDEGEVTILDETFDFPDDYEFIKDGKTRSPYYDQECMRPGATPQSIAQELDRDYGGSEYQIFGKDLYDIGAQSVLSPYARGVLYYDESDLEPHFGETEDGPWHLWCHRDTSGKPLTSGQYVVGCDIAAGLGGSYSSNSVCFVVDRVTNEQVAEYATNTLRPEMFADLVIATCKWFNDAYLIWEMNGPPGGAFGRQVLDRHYHNIYFRDTEGRAFKKKTKNPGWFSNDKNKLSVLSRMSSAVQSREYVIRSDALLEECRQYIYKDGKVVHSRSIKTRDDSAKGQSHGDRVIAAAIAWHAVKDRPPSAVPEVEEFRKEIPPGSMAWRYKEHEDRIKSFADTGWD
jgi:hypothetical protein